MIKIEKIELIEGSPCISNVEITGTASNYYYDQAEDKDFDLAEFYKALFPVIKNHIISLEKTMAKHIHKIRGERWIDRAAFFELAQLYGFDETYTQTVLAELGEFHTPIQNEAAA